MLGGGGRSERLGEVLLETRLGFLPCGPLSQMAGRWCRDAGFTEDERRVLVTRPSGEVVAWGADGWEVAGGRLWGWEALHMGKIIVCVCVCCANPAFQRESEASRRGEGIPGGPGGVGPAGGAEGALGRPARLGLWAVEGASDSTTDSAADERGSQRAGERGCPAA